MTWQPTWLIYVTCPHMPARNMAKMPCLIRFSQIWSSSRIGTKKCTNKMEHQTLEEVEWDLDFVRMTMTTKIIGGTFGSCWASCYFLLEAGDEIQMVHKYFVGVMIQGGNDWAPSHVEIDFARYHFFQVHEKTFDILRARPFSAILTKVWRPCSSMECLFQGSHMWWRGIALWDTRHQRVARVSLLMPTRENFRDD